MLKQHGAGWVLALVMGVVGFAPLARGGETWPASDWITTGTDCKIYTAGDVDGDGFADLLTINGNRDLCIASSVHGWKSAGWRVLAGDISPDAAALLVDGGKRREGDRRETRMSDRPVRIIVVESGRLVVMVIGEDGKAGERVVSEAGEGRTFTGIEMDLPLVGGDPPIVRDSAGMLWRIGPDGRCALDPAAKTLSDIVVMENAAPGGPEKEPELAGPPYDAAAREITSFSSGFGPAGGRMRWAVFATDKPFKHHAVRYAVIESGDDRDADGDGLMDAEEARLETDPRDRDTDGDGLLDGWEVHGLPGERVKDLGWRIGLYGASEVEKLDGATVGSEGSAGAADAQRRLSPRRKDVIVNISFFEQVDRAKFEAELPRIQRVYRELSCANPDGTTGVWLHFRDIGSAVPAEDQKMPWWDVGTKYFAKSERGLMHWMQVTPWGGGQSSETGDMGGCGNNWAVFAHELGHQVSLSHTGDSAPGWCPLYPSLMNYAYSYSFDGDHARPHFSSGEFRGLELDERHLSEKLPFGYERVKFLANHPFRFTLKDNGDGTTLIDWNHNGEFDEGEVTADVNYGGSTQAGERKTHTLTGSSPSLAYIAGKCFIAAATHKQTAVAVKMCKGGEEWTAEKECAASSTRFDPVLIGGDDYGVLLVRKFDGWSVTTVKAAEKAEDAPMVGALTPLTGLRAMDVSGVRMGERVLLVVRHDDDALEWRWLDGASGDKPVLSEARPLELTSMVPVGLAVNPADGSVTVVSSAGDDKRGPFCMRVSALRFSGDEVTEAEPEWTSGRCHCTTRPVAVYPFAAAPSGQAPVATPLTIFHTGWTDGNGTWTGWRTTRVGNKALNGGWLTCQLYDEWTRSRAGLGFADGPQGAYYAFRWDPGDHGEWKVNTMFVARGGYGIDEAPMRDFDDGAKIGLWGIRHSILTMPMDGEVR